MNQLFSKIRAFLLGQEVLERERRRAVRIPCRFKAGVQGLGAPVSVVNISALGMRIESMSPLKKGQTVTVEGREHAGQALTAEVIWTAKRQDQHVSGLMFTGSNEEKARSWMRTALDKLGLNQGRARERRAHVRVPTEDICYLCNRAGDRLSEGMLRNLGLGGALFVSDVQVAPNTGVRIQCETVGRPRLDELGTVRSCRKDTRQQKFLVGVEFEKTGSDPVRKFLKTLSR